MRLWIAAAGVFFLYVALCAALVPRLAFRRRARAAVWSLAGLSLCAAAHLLPSRPILHEWVLPPALLVLAYWVSGLLFAAPMPWAERALGRVDRSVRLEAAAAAIPMWLAEVLELAYVAIYPLIGIALLLHLLASPAPDATWFWSVVVITDLVCFSCLPWVQTRPPRAVTGDAAWASRLRPANVRLLGTVSIGANTFPSGHAAEAMALVLLVADIGWPVAGAMALAALLVSAGAVLGRYHYSADVLAGWVVALAVWMLVPR